MPKWKVTLVGRDDVEVEARAVQGEEWWVDFIRTGTGGATVLVRRFRREDVQEVALLGD